MRKFCFLIFLTLISVTVKSQEFENPSVISVENIDQVTQLSVFYPDGSDIVGDLSQDQKYFVEYPAGEQHWQTSVDFSIDGESLVTGSYDTTVRIWDVELGNPHLTLIGHLELVNDVAFSPDGNLIASCSGAYQADQDFSVRLWNSQTGELIHTLIGHTDQVMNVAFSPDGTQVASAGFDGTTRIWDVVTGEELQVILADDEWTFSVEFSPSGETLLTAGSDGIVKLWNLQSLERVGEFHHDDWIFDATFDTTGKSILSASRDGSVNLWNIGGSEPIWTAQITNGEVDEYNYPIYPTDVAVSPKSNIVAVAFGNTIRLLDALSGTVVGELDGHTNDVDGIAFNPDGTLLASASQDGSIRLWGIPATDE